MNKTFLPNNSDDLVIVSAAAAVAGESDRPDALTVLLDKGGVPLQSILCTEELNNRPARPPDYETENYALKSLVQALATSPETILQTLADTILKVFKADSAGLSLLTKDGKRFYWPAIAGGWQPHIGGGTPREFGPCGDVLDCNAPLLFKHWEKRYPYLVAATPPANEGLLVPFYVDGKAVGTIWAIAHTEHRKFDAEDLRQLESLTQFASSAYQAVESQKALEQSHTEIIQGVVQIDKAEASRELAQTLIGHLREEIKERQQVERDLRESEERFRTLFDLSTVAVYSIDTSGVIQNFNLRAAELWGRSPAIGDTDQRFCGAYKLYRPDGTFMPHDRCPMATVASGEIPEARDAEVLIQRPDGTRITVIVNIRPVKNDRGEITGAINCFYDITERKQAEIALRQSEEFNRSIIESSPDCIKVLDLEGNLLSMQSGQELLGIEDITPYLNKSWIAWWDGDDRLAAKKAIDAGAAGRDGNFVGCYRKPNSEPRWWDVVVSPMLDAKGKPERLLVVSREITERKQAEMSLSKLAAIVESSDDAILSTDLDGILTSWNRGAERLYSYSALEMIGQSIMRFIPPELHQEELASLESILQGKALPQYETMRYCKDGKLINISLTVSPILSEQGEIIGVSKIGRDITERKLNEKALRQSREEIGNHAKNLETQVADRTAKLNDSIKSLEILNYTMAHDLRAPIRAMKSFTAVLLEEVPLNETGKHYAERINKAAGRMDQLVHDLLEFGELSHLEFPVQALDLKTEIEKVLVENAFEIQTAQAEIQLQEPLPKVCGNGTLLHQILSNLTLNALKFVAPGVKPHIRIWSEERPSRFRSQPSTLGSSTVRLWLEDNGIGIAHEHQEQIFGIFQRLHPTHEFPGTGVGLAIIKRAAERMGGNVGVESELGKGSRFWIELPGIIISKTPLD